MACKFSELVFEYNGKGGVEDIDRFQVEFADGSAMRYNWDMTSNHSRYIDFNGRITPDNTDLEFYPTSECQCGEMLFKLTCWVNGYHWWCKLGNAENIAKRVVSRIGSDTIWVFTRYGSITQFNSRGMMGRLCVDLVTDQVSYDNVYVDWETHLWFNTKEDAEKHLLSEREVVEFQEEKEYLIDVHFTGFKTIKVKATSVEKAMEIAERNFDITNPDYEEIGVNVDMCEPLR